MKARVYLYFASLLFLFAAPSFATFRAADLVVVPVAASIPGSSGTNWHTDVEIMNVDTVPIDIQIVFLPSGGFSNTSWYENMENHVGGRKDETYGKIDERLKDIKPGNVVVIDDTVFSYWGTYTKGALLFFAYEAGTLMTTKPPGGNPKLIVVNSRTYTLGSSEGRPATYGQYVPGIPWYDYVSPTLKSKKLDQVVFTGLRDDDRYRTSFGMVNISDRMTSLVVQLDLNRSDGTNLKQLTLNLAPLSHDQWDRVIHRLFGQPTDTPLAGASLTVTVKGYYAGGAETVTTPALIAYLSRADNVTNDPIYIEQTYPVQLPWECLFNGTGCPPFKEAPGQASPSSPWLGHLRPPAP
jgi:hypothetical protein